MANVDSLAVRAILGSRGQRAVGPEKSGLLPARSQPGFEDDPDIEAFLKSLMLETADSASDGVETADDKFEALDAKKRAAAYLNLTKKTQLDRIPEDARVVTVCATDDDWPRVKKLFEGEESEGIKTGGDYAMQLGQNFTVSNDNGVVRKTYLLPDSANAYYLFGKIQSGGLKASMVMADYNVPVAKIGSTILPVDPRTGLIAADEKFSDPESAGFTVINRDGSSSQVIGHEQMKPVEVGPRYSSKEAIELAKKETAPSPVSTDAAFLVVDFYSGTDAGKPDDKIHQLMSTVSEYADVNGFYLSKNAAGQLVILAYEEVPLDKLDDLALDLQKIQGIKICMGLGSIKSTEDTVKVADFIENEQQLALREARAGLYAMPHPDFPRYRRAKSHEHKITDIGSASGLSTLEISLKPRAVRGGPSRLIGQTAVLKALERGTSFKPEDEIAGTVVEAEAGYGKTRIADSIKNALRIVLPSGSDGIDGHAMASFPAQLAAEIKALAAGDPPVDPRVKNVLNDHRLTRLFSLAKLPEQERLRIARAKNPAKKVGQTGLAQITGQQGIKEACLAALKCLKEAIGPFVLIGDDVQHADIESLQTWLSIFEEFSRDASTTGITGKHVLLTRPLDVVRKGFLDNHFNNLNGRLNRGNYVKQKDFHQKIRLQDDNGEPVQNLAKDPALAREYVFASLPVKIFPNGEFGDYKPENLGGWVDDLANRARSPLDLDNLIDEIVNMATQATSAEEQPLSFGQTIELKAAALEKLPRDNKDIRAFHVKRIREEMKQPTSKTLLDCIALLGGKLPIKDYVAFVRSRAAAMPGEQADLAGLDAETEIKELMDKRLIRDLEPEELANRKNPGDCTFGLRYDSMEDVVLYKGGPDDVANMCDLARDLYEYFSAKGMDEATLFKLFNFAAGFTPLEDRSFWPEYVTQADVILDQGGDAKDYRSLYSAATRIVQGGVMADVISELCDPAASETGRDSVIPADCRGEIRTFAVKALKAKVKGSLMVGAFNEGHEAIATLKKIQENAQPGDESFNLTAEYVAGFDAAEVVAVDKDFSKTEWELVGFYGEEIKKDMTVSPVRKLFCIVKPLLNKSEFEGCDAALAEYKDYTDDLERRVVFGEIAKDSPQYAEYVLFIWIKYNIQYCRVYQPFGSGVINTDYDIYPIPGLFDGMAEKIQEKIDPLERAIIRDQKEVGRLTVGNELLSAGISKLEENLSVPESNLADLLLREKQLREALLQLEIKGQPETDIKKKIEPMNLRQAALKIEEEIKPIRVKVQEGTGRIGKNEGEIPELQRSMDLARQKIANIEEEKKTYLAMKEQMAARRQHMANLDADVEQYGLLNPLERVRWNNLLAKHDSFCGYSGLAAERLEKCMKTAREAGIGTLAVSIAKLAANTGFTRAFFRDKPEPFADTKQFVEPFNKPNVDLLERAFYALQTDGMGSLASYPTYHNFQISMRLKKGLILAALIQTRGEEFKKLKPMFASMTDRGRAKALEQAFMDEKLQPLIDEYMKNFCELHGDFAPQERHKGSADNPTENIPSLCYNIVAPLGHVINQLKRLGLMKKVPDSIRESDYGSPDAVKTALAFHFIINRLEVVLNRKDVLNPSPSEGDTVRVRGTIELKRGGFLATPLVADHTGVLAWKADGLNALAEIYEEEARVKAEEAARATVE